MIKPMLASEMPEEIEYPVLCTPKIDGIRCVVVDGVLYSKTQKRIENPRVQERFRHLEGCDGELFYKDFNTTQSIVMSQFPHPLSEELEFIVFDNYKRTEGYEEKGLPMITVYDQEELNTLLNTYIDQGYEGLMARSPTAPYKFGRCTQKEGGLWKLKRWYDAEGTLLRVVEAISKDGVAKGWAGAVFLDYQGEEIKCGMGKGWTEEEKTSLLHNHTIGSAYTFKYFELTKKGLPRFPKLYRLRLDV